MMRRLLLRAVSPVYLRIYNKSYVRIPCGEIQYGHISKGVRVWFRGKLYVVIKGKVRP